MSVRTKDVSFNLKLEDKEKIVDHPKFMKMLNYTPTKNFNTRARLIIVYEDLIRGETDSENYEFILEHGETINDHPEDLVEVSSLIGEARLRISVSLNCTELLLPKSEKKTKTINKKKR